jgi:ditrans,polycis-polyprenyl diphosphate synthase
MPIQQYAHWLRDKAIDHIQRVLLCVLKAGPIPQHVAFVMDGNRRYARTKGMKVIQGHVDGFVALRRVRISHAHAPSSSKTRNDRPSEPNKKKKLCHCAKRQVMEICSSLEIKVVSVYAFAIDNFKRPKDEVDGLMNLAEKGLLELCQHGCVTLFRRRNRVENLTWLRGTLAEHGVRLNCIGKTHLFPPEVQAALAKAEEMTKNNHR